jgi:hypothetical protein
MIAIISHLYIMNCIPTPPALQKTSDIGRAVSYYNIRRYMNVLNRKENNASV